jgi:hypothetical protein
MWWWWIGCGGKDDGAEPTEPGIDDNFGVVEDQGEEGCDNLLPDCLYPFPSDAYVAPDGTLSLPTLFAGTFDPASTNRNRGFGAASPILFQLPGAALPADAVFDPAPSLSAEARTVLVDAETGERIPHWVETDWLSPDLDPPLLVIRPSVPLPRGREVVVGVRGLTDGSGATVEAPAAFVALRDREASVWKGVHARRAHYEAVVFPALEAAGVARASLQLAWSFPVQSDADATRPLLAVRDAVFAALPPEGPAYAIDAVYACDGGGDDPPDCHPSIRLIIDGTVEVPSAVEPPDALGIRRARFDAAGAAVIDGVERWPFRLQLPHAAFDGPAPVPVLQYGHGFLGGREEANNGWLREMADRTGFAILACDLQGMSTIDGLTWVGTLTTEGGRFPELQELAWQGVVNQLVQQRLVKTSLAEDPDPRLRRDDGALAWDPSTVWYYGNSQGGSVGTLVTATSLDVERGVLGVPGSGYPFLLHRSVDFDPFVTVMRVAYPFPDAIPVFLALLGTGWDASDPLTFAPHLHGDPLPGTPDKEALFHVAKEDREVVNEASFVSARAAGAALMIPAVRPVPLLAEEAYPASPGAALVEVDFGIPDDPTPLDPPDGDPSQPDEGNTHGWLRAWPPAQDQLVAFLRDGRVLDVCEGSPCRHDGKP